MGVCTDITSECFSNWQAVDALKQLYLEFPSLYNSSIVCSFMPDVVYKVMFPQRLLWVLLVLPGNLLDKQLQFRITSGLLKSPKLLKMNKV